MGTMVDVARPNPRVLDVIGTVVRLGLSAVFFVAGIAKVIDPTQSYQAVSGYQLFPYEVNNLIAMVLPFLEIGLALLLLIGLGTRIMAVLSALLLLSYIAGVAQAWARGLTIDCGCFGGGGQVAADQTHYPEEIARDIGFLVLAGWLTFRPSTLLSLDRLLIGSSAVEEDEEPVEPLVSDQKGE